jgi:hypothetical protein
MMGIIKMNSNHINSNHIMLDLKTWGTRPDALIISIGAVEFNPNKVGDFGDRFHVAVDPEDAYRYGLTIDPSTIMGWMSPDFDDARKRLLANERLDLASALEGLSEWMGKDAQVWGNGATFDNVILASAYKAAFMERPWSYKADMCFRTMRKISRISCEVDASVLIARHDLGKKWDYIGSRDFVAHDALDDAVFQAFWLQCILDSLGIIL